MEVIDLISNNLFNLNIKSCVQLAGDASFRKYYRVTTEEKSYILMEAKNDNSLLNFIKIQKFLQQHQILVPEIIDSDIEAAQLLLTDLGDHTMFDVVNQSNCNTMYKLAIDNLISMQLLTRNAMTDTELNLGRMDSIYLRDRIRLFKYWYIEQYLEIPSNMILDDICEKLVGIFNHEQSKQATTFVHQDYHSKNIMVHHNCLYNIDFQDAMLGPYTYDLISILQDLYVTWDEGSINKWVTYYKDTAIVAGLFTNQELSHIQKNMDYVALSRHLKNLGTFARLALSYQKPNYLKFMPQLQKYILNITCKYQELEDLHEFILLQANS